jgi:tetratricopeptide (TPR) repeat protein
MGLPDGPPVHIRLQADHDAIRWLNEHISGTPIVLQSDLWFYVTYGTRVAANTGLPTIVSPLHASEQHDPVEVAARDLDVQTIYRTTDPAETLRLLAQYHVDYIYVGAIERAAYGAAGIAKFDQMTGGYLRVAYRNAGVTIYQVNDGVYSIVLGGGPALPPIAAQPVPQALAPDEQASLRVLEQQVAADPTAIRPAFTLAQRYRDSKRLDDAAAVIGNAARAHPQDVAVQHLWGDILRDAGRYDEAEAAYRAAVTADPSASNYNKLGAELIKWDQLDKAIAALNQALALDPSAPTPFYQLGVAYEKQGQPELAAEQYRAYLAKAGADAPYRSAATQALERLAK